MFLFDFELGSTLDIGLQKIPSSGARKDSIILQ